MTTLVMPSTKKIHVGYFITLMYQLDLVKRETYIALYNDLMAWRVPSDVDPTL